tara:strand:+ start:55 stop:549 length:495 start_codon:yes stop_codon:yes gene_type:complete
MIQYGMDKEIPNHLAKTAIVEPETFYHNYGQVVSDKIHHKYIRIPTNFLSGSCFDLVNGITVDPNTWAEKLENFINPVEDHLPPSQDFLRICTTWNTQPALAELDFTDKINWEEIGWRGPHSSWECQECTMPNGRWRGSCWACGDQSRCGTEVEEYISLAGDDY